LIKSFAQKDNAERLSIHHQRSRNLNAEHTEQHQVIQYRKGSNIENTKRITGGKNSSSILAVLR